MPSKLGGMLASGRPVVAAVIPGGQIARAVEGAGLVVPSGDAVALASAVRLLADDPALRATLGAKARSRARADWDREPILARFERELLALAEA
jgi:colanic acid biosynthesis glycosyl transferase WcaI